MKLKHKTKLLNLNPITDDIRSKHLNNQPDSNFKYYKMYGKQIMFYTEKYIANNTFDFLINKDNKNKYSFCGKTKYEGWLFRLELRMERFMNLFRV